MVRRKRRQSKKKTETNASDNAQPEMSSELRRKIKTLTTESLIPKLPSLSRIISVIMLIIGTLAVGALFYRVMAVFFVPLFLAAALVVIFRPIHQWFLDRLGNRRRIAAGATTSMILVIVLLPIFIILSVAASQFTTLVSQVNFNDLTAAIQRGREQFGLTLPNPNRFRRLDQLADQLDEPGRSEEILARIEEAKSLVNYLQPDKVPNEAAKIANERLDSFCPSCSRQ